MTTALTIIGFVLVLGLLVLLHEFGHFIAAKIFKVKVEEFGIGFPPKAINLGKRGDTNYTLNWIPLGGFVKLKGEEDDGSTKDADSFASKPAWQKIIILGAGVFMNFVCAVLILAVGYMAGIPTALDQVTGDGQVKDVKIMIYQVEKGSPAEKAGIKPGDAIVSIDNKTFSEIAQIQDYTKQANGRTLQLDVKRGSQDLNLAVGVTVLPGRTQPGMGVALLKAGTVSYSPPMALWRALVAAGALSWLMLTMLGSAVRHLAFDNFVGPVGIVAQTTSVVQLGWTYVLLIVAQVSLSLAIMNLLPIPALDGGRILFTIIEKIRGKAITPKIEQAVHLAGFMLLIAMLILITFRDVWRLVPW